MRAVEDPLERSDVRQPEVGIVGEGHVPVENVGDVLPMNRDR